MNKDTEKRKNIQISKEEMANQAQYMKKIREANQSEAMKTGKQKLFYLQTYGCPLYSNYKTFF